ncbi:MAG: hypothetical protein ACLGHP_05290 [Vicinamibacteria bacterium]
MIRRLGRSTLWIAAGGVVTGGLYWLFLNTPESNVLMLAASAALVLAMLAVASATAGGALLAWTGPAPSTTAAARGLAATPALVAGLVVGGVAWWAAARLGAWTDAQAGEIAAWFIATFDWADATPFFRAVAAAVFWVQWVVAPVLALAVVSAALDGGLRAVLHPGWLGRALHPRRLALATLWVVVLVVLPLRTLSSSLTGLPPTWVEPMVVGLRLAAVGLVAAAGWALVCGTVTGRENAAGGGGREAGGGRQPSTSVRPG